MVACFKNVSIGTFHLSSLYSCTRRDVIRNDNTGISWKLIHSLIEEGTRLPKAIPLLQVVQMAAEKSYPTKPDVHVLIFVLQGV